MKKSRWMLAILGLLALAGPVAAQDRGLYLGGSFGQAEYADTCDNVTTATACRDHDESWRLFGGYRFNRTVAVELGFADLGNVTAVTPTGVRDVETRSWDLAAVLSIPIVNRLSAFGKLGAYRARTSAKLISGTATPQAGESNSGFTYGAGLGFDLGPLGLRAEWQRYDNAGGGTTGEDTIDLFSLGALFRF